MTPVSYILAIRWEKLIRKFKFHAQTLKLLGSWAIHPLLQGVETPEEGTPELWLVLFIYIVSTFLLSIFTHFLLSCFLYFFIILFFVPKRMAWRNHACTSSIFYNGTYFLGTSWVNFVSVGSFVS